MRVFAVSDVHIDYQENLDWLNGLSTQDYVDDVLILAGDLTDDLQLLAHSFDQLSNKFKKVLYVPGNHELWVNRCKSRDSLEKYQRIKTLADEHGISQQPFIDHSISIIPLLGWYDYSFGQPSKQLTDAWTDFHACCWPNQMQAADINQYFLEQNKPHLNLTNQTVISFSHFVPRIDLMPSYIPQKFRYIYPVLGSNKIEQQIRQLKPDLHIYGHSHVNRNVVIDDIQYINNAFAYPRETRISAKQLLCVYQD
jgi:predicted phosphodiesterase